MTDEVVVVIHASEVEYHKEGYRCPDVNNPYEQPQGLRSYPAIFSCPSEPPFEHWPNLISLIVDNSEELDRYENVPVYLYDSGTHATYFVFKLEPVVYLTIIFQDKKKQDDKNVMQFIGYLGHNLRMIDVFDQN
eukprot:TRINITY_DN3191_c0_g1_i4.p1 TRINITY_DN3191_c0_g1~~TRINITY_DN3191_c0_g1_i4.p1  ORF type:complete len:134 (-),score=30.30 TRINITY_DN3191_c0_g1_i4:172-573(-)